MKRRATLLLAALLSLIAVVAGTSITTERAVSAPAPASHVVGAQSSNREIIDGAANPERIPNHVAYSLLFRFISKRETETEERHVRSYIRRIGLGDTDANELLAAAEEFRWQVSLLDVEAADIVVRHHPVHTTTHEENRRLNELANQKVTIVLGIVTSLPRRLSAGGWVSLRRFMNEHFKSRTRMSVSRAPRQTAAVSLSAFAPAMTVGFPAMISLLDHVTPPSYQRPNSSFYSDEWIDGSGSGYVVGCGVTEVGYLDSDTPGQTLHEADVYVTITSPLGRSQSVLSRGSWWACSTPELPWDWNDMGDYVVLSRHYSECPATEFGYTSTQKTIGYSLSCYAYDGQDPNPPVAGFTFRYRIVDGCGARVSCWDTYSYAPNSQGMRMIIKKGFIRDTYVTGIVICSPIGAFEPFSSCTEASCVDV